MKHLATSILILFWSVVGLAQTGEIVGTVKDKDTGMPMGGVNLIVSGTDIESTSNADGSFTLKNVPEGDQLLILSFPNYQEKEWPLTINEGEILNLGTIEMTYSGIEEDAAEDAVITVDETELTSEMDQAISGLLHSSRDVFVSTAAYTFGSARFRMRGYNSNNGSVYINGTYANDPETGRPYWSDWGGLNDAVRDREIVTSLDVSDFAQPTIGGVTNINTRAKTYRPGVRISYSSANRSYTNRVMATASTGMMDNNWAVTVSGSHRWGNEGYIGGTFYDAWAYFLSAEKFLNDKHSLNITAFAAPVERGKQYGAPQEVYDLTGNNFYNANWGYQMGEKRNSRVFSSHKPIIILNHFWNVNPDLEITTGLNYTFGRTGATAMNWYDAPNPRPSYYRNLPSYNEDNTAYTGWNERHVQWNDFYQANYKNLFAVVDPYGMNVDTLYGMRSKYMVEDRVISQQQMKANTVLEYKLNPNIDIIGGLNYRWYKGRHYTEVDDLLGGDWWLDIDQFAERDFSDKELAQSDLNKPNRIVKEGDVFGYDYDANISYYHGWAQGDFSYNKFDVYASGGLSFTQFYRTGNMRNGKFPENSYGDAEKQNFTNFNAAAGATYKLTGRHIFTGNATYQTRAPYFDNAYVSPRTRNDIVEGLTSEKIMSTDLNYILRLPYLRGRITGYYTTFEDQVDLMSFYHDEYRSFVNYIQTGIDKKHFGTEIGLEGTLFSSFTLTGVAALGQYTYDSRPNVTIVRDNDSEIIQENEPVYVKNFYVDGTPQTALALGLEYRSPRYWWVEVTGSYFNDIYLSFNPARRTELAVAGLDPNSPYGSAKIAEITNQEKLPEAYVLDIKGGKSWRINDYYVSLFFVVSNILDNREVITGGYEQLRFDYDELDVNKFPSVYFYMYGTTYFTSLTISF